MNENLYAAAGSGDSNLVKDCLQKGADVNYKHNDDQTPLHLAASRGQTEVTKVLLEAGASLSAVDDEGRTPLHLAARRRDTEVTKVLVEAGASLSAENNNDQTPLHQAALTGQTEVTKVLVEAGASLSAVDKQGRTPLHWAALNGHTEVTKVLSEAGASLSAVDNKGKTPHDVAKDNVKKLLQKYMDKVDMSSSTDEIVEVDSQNVTDPLLQNTPVDSNARQSSDLDDNLHGNELLQKSQESINRVTATRKDTILWYENCVYLGGAGNVVKSTLASILIGEDISKEWNSTDELNIYFGRNGIDLKTEKMVPLKLEQGNGTIPDKIREGTYKIEIAPSDLVVFGGHRSFDMTHQLFMRHKGTFVLMFNGKLDLSDGLEDYEQGETTESILKHWVNSILSYCVDDDDDKDKDILPMILFCATHSDEFNQEDRKDRKKKLIHNIGKIFKDHKQKDRIRYNDIFFIDGREKNDPEIMELKSKLVEVAFKQKSWGKPMSIAWVRLELQMSELRFHNMNIISKEELMTLNQRNGDLELSVEHIKDFLNDQHSLGKILYFDQQGLDHFIIVQPQSLVNILRSFITAECFWPEDKKLKGILETLRKTGEITKQNLLELWSQEKFHQHMPNDDFKEFIIQVLVHLDILREQRHYKPESYLVPCMVKHRPPKT